MPCDEMSAYWAAQRIKGLSLYGAVMDGVKRSLGLNKKPNAGKAVKTLLETFRYPRLGPGMMWEAARDKIEATGSKVYMAHALKQLASDGKGGWRMTASEPDGDIVVKAKDAISSALRPSILFALIDMGPAILERTPHSVIATAHHRGERGLHDVIKAFLSSDDAARQIVMKHESDYLLICTDIGESALYAREAPDGLMAHLRAGDTPAWLEEVPLDDTPESFRVWRVKD